MLGARVGGVVRPGEFVWEKNSSVFVETIFGRQVIFLASSRPGGPRDVYRARVRVSLEGRPLAVTSAKNLTSSPLGDELALTADGAVASRYAAFASSVYGKITAVTVLDLRGDGGVVGRRGALDDALGALSNLGDTGSLGGVGRVVVTLAEPRERVEIQLDADALRLRLPDDSHASLALATRQLSGEGDAGAAEVQPVPHLRKPPILWAVDTVRGVVGPEVIAALEQVAFGARDSLKQASYAVSGGSPRAVASMAAEGAPPPSPPLDASAAGADGGYWPPAKLPSIWEAPEPGEGEWAPVTHSFLKKPAAPDGARPPPYFYTTWLSPDAKRPYSRVLIVALDMRQLEVAMEGGVEDPKPLTGTKSFGRIPRDPAILGRVVGAFNGAFKTTHGAYGMMVEKKVLLPPKPGAATVIVTDDRHVGMGTWPASDAIPDGVASYRQNLEPLVENGRFNPTGRQQWGFQLPGHSVMTERSGICVTKPGHFLYVWGDDVSGVTLGKAMAQAGCEYGMHLDMNPKHTGFVFASIRDVQRKDYDARLLTREMEIMPERYIEWSPKDFFYVMLRDTRDASALGPNGVKWQVDKGVQPAPSWLPGIFETRAQAGGKEVVITGIDAGRAAYRVVVGRGEAAAPEGAPRELPAEDQKKVVAAFGLGNGRPPRPLALSLGGSASTGQRGKSGFFVVHEGGDASIVAGDPPAPERTLAVVELPLLVAGGNVTMSAESVGATRVRVAACQLASGRIAFASTTADTDAPNAVALAKLGCRAVVALDRGSHEDSFVERAGGATGKIARGEQTTLYAVASPMKPRAFAWHP